jgi:multisubunit Na+/H+ antiporter MnhC subunit
VKAAAFVLAFLLSVMRVHVSTWFAGPVPLPVLAAVVIGAALTGLTVLIVRKVARDGSGVVPRLYWSVTL